MLSPNPTDKSVGYFHSSASPTFSCAQVSSSISAKADILKMVLIQ